MPYILDLTGPPAEFMDALGGNNHGTGCWWIFCGGDRPVLMSTLLQTCGFYVCDKDSNGKKSCIKTFWDGANGVVRKAENHETDPDRFVLCCGDARLEVERQVRARTYAESDPTFNTIELAE